MNRASEVTHTPGPWSSRVGYTNGEPVSYEIEAGVGHIATVWMAVGSEAQDAANARLIAAAPEMLGLLGEVAEQADETGGINLQLGARIVAIIAKAEGRADA